MIMTNADRIFSQNWVEQYRTNFYDDPDNVHRTALQFVQSHNTGNEIIGGAFWWGQTREYELWADRISHLFASWEPLAR